MVMDASPPVLKRRKQMFAPAPNVVPSLTSEARPGIVEPELDEIPKLVLVELHKDDAESVEKSLERMWQILPDDKEESDEWKQKLKVFIEIGAVAIVVLTMQKWRNQEKIQELACSFLMQFQYLCCEGEDEEASIGELSMANTGGMEAIITAINTFQNSRRVRSSGVGALWNLFDPLMKGATPEKIEKLSTRFVEDLNGLAIVNEVMKKFASDCDVVECCCGLLNNLAHRKKFRKPIVNAGLVSLVGRALENHFDDKDVKKIANAFMKTMFGDGGIETTD